MTTARQNAAPGIALVTGAAHRIGRAIALHLGGAGWTVGVHYKGSAGAAAEVVRLIEARGGEAAIVRGDLASMRDVGEIIPRCIAAIGAPTCLVNNASVFADDRIETLDAALWDEQMIVNLKAPVFLSQSFARHLPADQQGAIINIIDQRVWRPSPAFFSYGITKSALYAATRMLAQALAPRIRVNGIGPGPVLKSIHQSDGEFDEEWRDTLLKRPTSPEEIAAAVSFLLSQPSMTGQMIALDAGQHISF
jgi:NAD(P)-dependent dehydrogenase (short-subunit alcohol dehydrogenase family)